MVRLLSIFIILLASVWLGVKLQHDPGYLLIAIHHWTIETTLVVAMIGLVLVFIFLHLLLLWIQWLIHLPRSFSEWLGRQRAYHARAKTRQGLIEFSEGYWSEAKNHLIKALPDTDTPLLNYLTAARAAQEMGDSKLRDDYLRQAQQSMPEAKIAVELTQAQLQLANHQWEQALATLRHLQDLAPHHPYVLKLLMHLYEEVKDWPQLIALLPELKRNQVISDDQYQRLQQRAYYQAMLDLIKQGHDQALANFMKSLPPRLNEDPEIIAEYGYYLFKQERLSEAELLLRRKLHKRFDEDLLGIYGQINYSDNQLQFAESLLKEHPHSAPLFLCLGRLSQHKNLWGKAKMYFEQSIECGATPMAYLELGKLLKQLSDEGRACAAYERGLALSIHLDREEP